MSMMKETDQTLLHVNASLVLDTFLNDETGLPEAVANLAKLCRRDLCHINGAGLESQIRRTLELAVTGEIEPAFALTHLVRLATARVLFVDSVQPGVITLP